MFNISGVELAVILLAALLLLGPQRLPELARGLGKFLREFRRQTDDVRTMVEREFYQMDQEIQKIGEPTPNSVPASAEKPAMTAPPDPTSPASTEAIVPPPALASEPLPPSAPSGSTGELYDADYHAAEANGLIPSTIEAPPEPMPSTTAEPPAPASLHPPGTADPPNAPPHQEPTPRAK